jgi:hypothetical protein
VRTVAQETTYYAIIGRGHTSSDPTGLARRVLAGDGVIDESLRRDLTWGHTNAIAEWDRGEELTRDLVKISEAEAGQLIERFREKWNREG